MRISHYKTEVFRGYFFIIVGLTALVSTEAFFVHYIAHFEPIMVDIWLISGRKCDVRHFLGA